MLRLIELTAKVSGSQASMSASMSRRGDRSRCVVASSAPLETPWATLSPKARAVSSVSTMWK